MAKIKTVKVVGERSWSELVAALRQVYLLGDKNLLPYKGAKIEMRLARISEVRPISLYLLRGQLEVQRQLHKLFWDKYKIDTLNLDGRRGSVFFKVNNGRKRWVLSPPIVEVSKIDGGVPVLVDGEQRLTVARELKKKVRVVWISGVPARYPVIAKPARWEQMKVYDRTPAIDKKRIYRFSGLVDFPDISGFSKAKVNEKNYRYFFYRVLDEINSGLVRFPGAKR